MKVRYKGKRYRLKMKNILKLLAVVVAMLAGLAFYFRNPFVESYTLEAGSALNIEDLLKDDVEASFKTKIDESITHTVGTHEVSVSAKGLTFGVEVEVVDTVAPTATAVKGISLYNDETFDPNAFVTDIKDVTKVTVSFASEIDKSTAGKKEVEILLVDEGKNETIVTSEVTVLVDTEAPVIGLPAMITAKKGETILYKANVLVVDNRDGEITNYKVDNSKVNTSKVGVYTVTYTATDKAGNTSTKDTKVHIVEYNEATLKKEANQYADQILSEIITSGMTKSNKIKVIYDYVQSIYRVSSTHQGNVDEYTIDALTGFKGGRGDCYVANGMARYLLERAGISTKGALLKGTDKNHLMFMAKCEDGWYYYSAYPRKSGVKPFKWTGSKVLSDLKNEGVTQLPSGLPKTPSK